MKSTRNRLFNFIITILIFLFITFSVAAFISIFEEHTVYAQANQEIVADNIDFSDNSVLVTMDKDMGGVNKIHDKSFFGDVAISNITDLTYRKMSPMWI